MAMNTVVMLENSDGTSGLDKKLKGIDGAAFVTPDGYFPDAAMTGVPKHANDVPNYTADATQGAVLAAEVVRRTYTAAEKVTAVSITCRGQAAFEGVYATLSKTSGTAEQDALKSTDDDTGADRFWVPKAVPVLRKVTGAFITSVSMTAIDTDGSEDNNVDIEPF